MAEQEYVMVVPTKRLFPRGNPSRGFHVKGLDGLLKRIYRHYEFIPRTDAESNHELKQIIPYAVVTFMKSVFLLQRHDTQDEARLHNKMSIGVGGHVNPMPVLAPGIIERTLQRELDEELNIDVPFDYELVGYINDDSNDVGKVHLGMVYHLVPSTSSISVRETGQMSGSFVTAFELKKQRPRMETWSQMLVDKIRYFLPGEDLRAIA